MSRTSVRPLLADVPEPTPADLAVCEALAGVLLADDLSWVDAIDLDDGRGWPA
jgi:hypothetical protein